MLWCVSAACNTMLTVRRPSRAALVSICGLHFMGNLGYLRRVNFNCAHVGSHVLIRFHWSKSQCARIGVNLQSWHPRAIEPMLAKAVNTNKIRFSFPMVLKKNIGGNPDISPRIFRMRNKSHRKISWYCTG